MRTALLALALLVGACATYQEDLNRGQRFYQEHEYERALSIFRVLEDDVDSLTLNDQARFAYLRGMTDYRLGFRADARHWLAVGKAIEQEHPGGLTQEWKQRLDEALEDLNRDVYGGAERFDKSATPQPGAAASAAPPASATAPAAAPAASCTADTDCGQGQHCQSGQCVPL